MIIYLLVFILFCVGLYGLVSQRNLIKLIISLSIVESSVYLFLVSAGWRKDAEAPIMKLGEKAGEFALRAVDPFPQAMVLTAIVIGVGILALLITIALRIYHRYGTYDITEIRRLKG